MNKKILHILFLISLSIMMLSLSSFRIKENRLPHVYDVDIKEIAVDERKTINGLEKIPIFDKISNKLNNLSDIASDIKFIPLDNDPPFNPFHIYDIQIDKDYIFLMGMHHINMYDWNGHFVRNIGSRGQGPREFIQLAPPLQLDHNSRTVYATDSRGRKIIVYDFKGNYLKNISHRIDASAIELIDTSTIAIRQGMTDRYKPETPLITFMNDKGEITNKIRSNLYPVLGKMETLGSDASFLWRYGNKIYYLEYGADTIFQIEKNRLTPVKVLSGNGKPKFSELFQKETGKKLKVLGSILRPNAAIFESGQYILFKLSNDYENYFALYDKENGAVSRTMHENATKDSRGARRMDYFMDDIVSGLQFKPEYQSEGKAIAFISAETIIENKEEILSFIETKNSSEAKKMKSIVKNMNEEDNPLLVIVTFK